MERKCISSYQQKSQTVHKDQTQPHFKQAHRPAACDYAPKPAKKKV